MGDESYLAYGATYSLRNRDSSDLTKLRIVEGHHIAIGAIGEASDEPFQIGVCNAPRDLWTFAIVSAPNLEFGSILFVGLASWTFSTGH